VTCVVCGNVAATEALTAEDWSLAAVPGTFRYVRCATCGTVRLDPQPSDEQLAAAYPDRYVGRGLPTQALQRAGGILGRGEARRLVALGNTAGQALDAGCGDGTFLVRLRAAGWRGPLHGLEPGPAAAAAARARGVEVAETTVEALDADGAYDLVVLRHVIEHVRDPLGVLERVRTALRPDGIAYVATPDERALSARVFGRYWHGYDPPRHLWVFRPPALRRLLDEAGLTVLDERWHLGGEVWAASLGYAISPKPTRRRRLASVLNPLVAVPALAIGAAEQALHRSTMYGVVVRRS